MAIDPEDMKAFAQANQNSDEECTLRASISRAYYFAYHSLLPFAERLPATAPKNTKITHREMSERIREWHTSAIHPKLAGMKATSQQLRRELDAARLMRLKADYRLDDEIIKQDAAQQLIRARRVGQIAYQIKTLIEGSEKAA